MAIRFGDVRKVTIWGYFVPGRTESVAHADTEAQCRALVQKRRAQSERTNEQWQGGEFRPFETEMFGVFL